MNMFVLIHIHVHIFLDTKQSQNINMKNYDEKNGKDYEECEWLGSR
jgi:hypothetical protein